MKLYWLYGILLVAMMAGTSFVPLPDTPARVLIFYKTRGYYHPSIPAGAAALYKLCLQNNVLADTTADSKYFTEDSLKHYRAVIFLSTTQNIFTSGQQTAFERYIQAGGGFVGIHAATDTEYGWAWYNKLVGAQFMSHPRPQKAVMRIVNKDHPSTSFLPDTWEMKDEWYNFKNIQPHIKVLANLDETTYEGGKNGKDHPIAWYHDYDGGRAFYTGGGHMNETFADSLFLKHVWGGITYAMGDGTPLDFSKSYAVEKPEENRFVKKLLANDLNEPMELAIAPDHTVYYIERGGNFYSYDPASKKNTLIKKFKVITRGGNGLLGITLDPNFAVNNHVYFFYTPAADTNKLKQHISRFVLRKNVLDPASEKVILQIPIDHELSAHTGGSMAFDQQGNFYISTGDNTTPFQSSGYAPIDEQPGRKTFDAQRSSANTNDLRGKILRIRVTREGGYIIPEGNLFPRNGSQGRPEIYVMGVRNPYRISVDTATGYLYWGEVGPDAGRDGQQGPRGYDEFNQAKAAGNFGWPYFIGNSKAYHTYNFKTKTTGPVFNQAAVSNNSVNNTGTKQLPSPQKAMIWYPYNYSEEFPQLGLGGRCAMGGPVYHFNPRLPGTVKLPVYFDNCWFVYDWMRNWIMAIRLDSNSNFVRMEPFMAMTGNFKRPVDIEIGPDGALYVLEYGSIYGIDNVDARLVKIEFNPGNRQPVAHAAANITAGAAPLKVNFHSRSSSDPDDDTLNIQWLFDGKTVGSTAPHPSYTFEKNGTYKVVLRVSDKTNQVQTDTLRIVVGNTAPVVNIETKGNRSFYWNNTSVGYNIAIDDKEDTAINYKRLQVNFDFAAGIKEQGHQSIPAKLPGEALIAGSDCKTCHTINQKAVGPSFMEVARKYKNTPGIEKKLIPKIIDGGGGVWGPHAMNAHPQHNEKQVKLMVDYILSLARAAPVKSPMANKGTVSFNEHKSSVNNERYKLDAVYTDGGNKEAEALQTKSTIEWRNPRIPATEADELYDAQLSGLYVGKINNGAWLLFRNIDLNGISKIQCQLSAQYGKGGIEIHTKSVTGPIIGSLVFTPTGVFNKKFIISTPITAGYAVEDLYFVVKDEGGREREVITIDWIEFIR